MGIALSVVKRRLHELGEKSASAARQGGDEITVQLPSVRDAKRAAAVLEPKGVLAIWDFEGLLEPVSLKSGVATPFRTRRALLAADPTAPVAGAVIRASASMGGGWYAFAGGPSLALTSRDFIRREIRVELGAETGQPELLIAFTHSGSLLFQRITKWEYERGRLLAGLHGSAGRLNQKYVQHNVIALDGVIEATPYVDYTDAALSEGTAGRSAVLLMPTRRAASNLAIVLRSGRLPFPLTVVRRNPPRR